MDLAPTALWRVTAFPPLHWWTLPSPPSPSLFPPLPWLFLRCSGRGRAGLARGRGVFPAVFRPFDRDPLGTLFFRLFFRLFSMSGMWHLCSWPQRLQGQGWHATEVHSPWGVTMPLSQSLTFRDRPPTTPMATLPLSLTPRSASRPATTAPRQPPPHSESRSALRVISRKAPDSLRNEASRKRCDLKTRKRCDLYSVAQKIASDFLAISSAISSGDFSAISAAKPAI